MNQCSLHEGLILVVFDLLRWEEVGFSPSYIASWTKEDDYLVEIVLENGRVLLVEI